MLPVTERFLSGVWMSRVLDHPERHSRGNVPRRSLPIAVFEASMNAEFGSDAHTPKRQARPQKSRPNPPQRTTARGRRPPPK